MAMLSCYACNSAYANHDYDLTTSGMCRCTLLLPLRDAVLLPCITASRSRPKLGQSSVSSPRKFQLRTLGPVPETATLYIWPLQNSLCFFAPPPCTHPTLLEFACSAPRISLMVDYVNWQETAKSYKCSRT